MCLCTILIISFNHRHLTHYCYLQKKCLHCSKPYNQLHGFWHSIVYLVDCTCNLNAVSLFPLPAIQSIFSTHSAGQSSSICYVNFFFLFCLASLHLVQTFYCWWCSLKAISCAIQHIMVNFIFIFHSLIPRPTFHCWASSAVCTWGVQKTPSISLVKLKWIVPPWHPLLFFIRPPPFLTSGFYSSLFCFWPGQISYLKQRWVIPASNIKPLVDIYGTFFPYLHIPTGF